MGNEYEIIYFVKGEGTSHWDYADNLLDALVILARCKQETGSTCVSLIWRKA